MKESLNEILDIKKTVTENLVNLSQNSEEKIVFSTSFGKEDQVIFHVLFANQIKNINVFTLDTGRLFPETYTVWEQTIKQYQFPIQTFYPNTTNLEDYVNGNGINAFYNSIALRKQCCFLRKVEPLERALKGAKVWITGLRAEQSDNRHNQEMLEWDEQRQLYKFNPLLHWTATEVDDYLNQHTVPYNTLHDKGFVSIGCAPCTRAVSSGESFRAGRWWWEEESKKECGLHK